MDIAELLATPPKAFDEFVVAMIESGERDGPPTARYQFYCRDCSGRTFTLEEVLSGEHGTAGIEPTCAQCSRKAPVFHASRDGYDGRLGNLRFLSEFTGRKRLCDYGQQPLERTLFACEVSYSIDPDELKAIAAEENAPPQDLLDGFAVVASNLRHADWRYVWDYECA